MQKEDLIKNEPVLSKNAIKVLEKRYLIRDSHGNATETPAEMFYRSAKTLAEADKNYGATQQEVDETTKEFYEYISKRYFMPNSPTLMNAGKDIGQLAACFVLPVEDSLEGIFETIKNTALIHQSGGGTGFSFSRLRPKNDIVHSTMGVSSGPVSFMEVFNAATEAVKQGGARRGANMGILRVDHPDILDFIHCKTDNDKLNNFNISVAITDKFMEALKAGEDYELINPRTKQPAGKLSAKAVFDIIVDGAWKNGEPGIVFIDRMNEYNPTPQIGEIESTNPCGEVPLLPYEACNLGSINLGLMIKNENSSPCVDWDKLKNTVNVAIHFLDNVITINKYPLPQIAQTVRNNRKIGLGVMGWADMLMQLGIAYNSEEGTKLALQIMEFIDYHSKVKSVELAKQRGKFANFKGSIYDGNFKDEKPFLSYKYQGKSAGLVSDEMWEKLDKKIALYGLRNATTTCIAPTGTISMIAGASGGIEPLFGLVFIRDIMDGTKLVEVNPVFENYAKNHGFYSDELMTKISVDGTLAHCSTVPEEAKKIFVCAHDISPYWHVKMQAAFQFHTDNAVSKTVNFVENATKEDVAQTYILAYENGLKGITVYRNNSRSLQPMNLQKKGKANALAGQEPDKTKQTDETKEHLCPECGAVLGYGEGCYICPNCGYSGCL